MRGAIVSLAAFLLLNGCVAAPSPDGASSKPYSMVVHGDSFTAALDLERGGDRKEMSWASGTEPGMASILQRLQASRPETIAANVAFSGARMGDVSKQAANAPKDADLVLVFLGINDLCMGATDQTYAADAADAFELIADAHPSARVVVFAISDLWRLHELHLALPEALALWGQDTGYCPEFFNPAPGPLAASIASARLEPFNDALQQAADRAGFEFSTATLWPGWTIEDFAGDYFHPDVSGESRLAAAAWPDVAP